MFNKQDPYIYFLDGDLDYNQTGKVFINEIGISKIMI
jgi:hypothetical protein